MGSELDFRDTTRNSNMNLSSEFVLSQNLWKYGSPVLLTVGTVGSVLTILVLRRKPLRQVTTMFYLTVLAFSDLAVLYSGLFCAWLVEAFGLSVQDISRFTCKLYMFVLYFSLTFSVWILVAVTVDRCVSVSFPIVARRWSTLQNARRVVVVVALIIILITVHLLWTVDLYKSKDNYICEFKTSPDLKFFVEKIWPWCHFTVLCVVPFMIILTCNCLIIRQLVVSARNLRAHRHPQKSDAASGNLKWGSFASTFSKMQSFARKIRNRKVEAEDICHKHEAKKENTTSEHDHCVNQSISVLSSSLVTEPETAHQIPRTHRRRSSELSASTFSSITDCGQNKSELKITEKWSETLKNSADTSTTLILPLRDQPRVREMRSRPPYVAGRKCCGVSSVTLLLLTVTSLFWILTAPAAIFNIVHPVFDPGLPFHEIYKKRLWAAFVGLLFYTNNAIHFFMYSLTGRRFRQEMMAMFRCARSDG